MVHFFYIENTQKTILKMRLYEPICSAFSQPLLINTMRSAATSRPPPRRYPFIQTLPLTSLAVAVATAAVVGVAVVVAVAVMVALTVLVVVAVANGGSNYDNYP